MTRSKKNVNFFFKCRRIEVLCKNPHPEVDSKPQIRFKGPRKLRDFTSRFNKLRCSKGAGRSRKRSIHGYVSIYRRSATQPLSLRWGFETTYNQSRFGITSL